MTHVRGRRGRGSSREVRDGEARQFRQVSGGEVRQLREVGELGDLLRDISQWEVGIRRCSGLVNSAVGSQRIRQFREIGRCEVVLALGALYRHRELTRLEARYDLRWRDVLGAHDRIAVFYLSDRRSDVVGTHTVFLDTVAGR